MQAKVAGVILVVLVFVFAPFADWQYAISAGSDIHSLLRGFGNVSLHTTNAAQTVETAPPASPALSNVASQEVPAANQTVATAPPASPPLNNVVSQEVPAATQTVATAPPTSPAPNNIASQEVPAANETVATAPPASPAPNNVVSQEVPAANETVATAPPASLALNNGASQEVPAATETGATTPPASPDLNNMASQQVPAANQTVVTAPPSSQASNNVASQEVVTAPPASQASNNVAAQEVVTAPSASQASNNVASQEAINDENVTTPGRWNRFFEENWEETLQKTGFRLAELRGPWPGQMRFATALFQDLPESLTRGKECDIIVNTGWHPAVDRLARKGLDSKVPRVWLLINQEPVSMQDFWKMMPHSEVRRAVMVGNWWNKTHAEVADERISSIWLPFGSSYLADLPLTTPLDLQHRKKSIEIGVRGREIRKQWSPVLGNRRSTVVYQQNTCWTNMRIFEAHPPWENYRERFWDRLNQRMKEEIHECGYAAGRCNGALRLGHTRLPRLPIKNYSIQFRDKRYWYRFHEGLIKYSWFRFVVALENTINMSGYVSEKLVQALLAGAVPIFAGSAEAPQMLNERSFLLLTPGETEKQTADLVIDALRDEGKYAELWQEDAVSDEQLRRFFSWHPAVWPSHGDSLRRRIVSELDRLCQ